MDINVKLSKNFTTQYNKLQAEFGTDIARINGFDDAQLSYTDFIQNFIDQSTVADASVDGNSNVSHKDIVTLLNEMPKPHRKLLAFNKIYIIGDGKYGKNEINSKYKAKTQHLKAYKILFNLPASSPLYYLNNLKTELDDRF